MSVVAPGPRPKDACRIHKGGVEIHKRRVEIRAAQPS